jgi:hypothetical protein
MRAPALWCLAAAALFGASTPAAVVQGLARPGDSEQILGFNRGLSA